MAKRYVQVYYDFIHSLTPLSDAERGRLFTAMLEYAGQGTEPDLRGNERFVWPQLKSQIDRDNERYSEISQIKSEAGKQGGLAKAGKRKQKKHMPAHASICHQDKDKEEDNDKDDNKDEEEDEDRAYARATDHGGGLLTDFEAQSLADGIHGVLDAAKRAGFPDTQADWDKCNALVTDYGPDAVLAAISVCTDRPMDKRNYGYLAGVLAKDPKGGKLPGKPPDRKGKGYFNPFYDLAKKYEEEGV